MSIANGVAASEPSTNGSTLTESHRRELCEGSGLTDATIAAAGIYTEFDRVKLAAALGWKSVRRSTAPALVFPYVDEFGAVAFRRIKPAVPPKDAKTGKPRKYLQPKGVPVHAYIPAQVRDKLSDAGCRLVLTEGEKKCLAANQAGFACVGLSGVDCWHTKGTAKLLPDLDRIAWQGRQVFIAFDSDAADNDNVTRNESELAAVLADRGAIVKIVRIPPADDGAKQGVDDFLVARGPGEFQKLLERADDPEPPDGGTLKAPAKSADPADEAKHIIAATAINGRSPLVYWRDSWWLWRRGAYREVLPSEVRGEVVESMNTRYIDVRSRYVADVLEQIKAKTLLRSEIEPPSWLGKQFGEFIAAECLATRSEIIHLPTLVAGKEFFSAPASPAFFTTTAADFDLDRDADKPEAWLTFLNSLWGDDPQAITALQEWFGLLLLPDTSFQKLLLLVGPPRSGKGTIGRILTALVGRGNVVAPTMNSLTAQFGLSPLLGKSVAVISDARLSGRADQAVVVERILSITGEDLQTVDRKHKSVVTCKLPTRFVVLTNELPRLTDASGAIVSRMILLETRRSWLGSEDRHLEGKLLAELPGIMCWAIDGWQRLREQGRLTQPDGGFESLAEMNDLASPVAAFVRDRCEVAEGLTAEKDELFAAWKSWCERHGREKYVGNSASFGRDLLAAFASVRSRRVGPRGERIQVYDGVGLSSELSP